MSKRFSVLDFGFFYTPVKVKHAKFLGTSTLIVTENHWMCQSWRHLLFLSFSTKQQTFLWPSPISNVLSDLSLQFVPSDSFCAFPHPPYSGSLCPCIPFCAAAFVWSQCCLLCKVNLAVQQGISVVPGLGAVTRTEGRLFTQHLPDT